MTSPKIIFDIMRIVHIFWKYVMKNAYLPKMNILFFLLQFGDWDIGPFMPQWIHTNPCNFVLVLTGLKGLGDAIFGDFSIDQIVIGLT